MDSSCVYFLVDLSIAQAKFHEFESFVQVLTSEAAKESGTLAYQWFLSGDRCRCRLLERYANSDAVQAHLNSAVVQQLVPKLLDVAKMERFEVYGAPNAEVVVALKALGAQIYPHWKGLSRTSA